MQIILLNFQKPEDVYIAIILQCIYYNKRELSIPLKATLPVSGRAKV